jgi:hypothetical protein
MTRVYITWVWKKRLSDLQHSFYFPEYPLAVKLKSKYSDILHDFLYVCVDCKIQPKM